MASSTVYQMIVIPCIQLIERLQIDRNGYKCANVVPGMANLRGSLYIELTYRPVTGHAKSKTSISGFPLIRLGFHNHSWRVVALDFRLQILQMTLRLQKHKHPQNNKHPRLKERL
jgi:hypothetical protein